MAEDNILKRGGRWVWSRCFNTWAKFVSTVLSIGGAIGGVLTLESLLAHLAGHVKNVHQAYASYLWVTFASVTLGATLYLFLLSKVQIEMAELRKQKLAFGEMFSAEAARSDKACHLLHNVAESVRLVVDETNVDADYQQFERILSGLRDFIHTHENVGEVCITLKILQKDQLVTVDRSGGSNSARDNKGDSQATDTSFSYQLFKSLHDSNPKQVVVRDARNLHATNSGYIKRARTCGFNSVIAFPIRGPRSSLPGLEKNQLYGILAIDSAESCQFDRWFDEKAPGHNWEQQTLTSRRSLDVYYAVADSLATIYLSLASRSARDQDAVRLDGGTVSGLVKS